MEEATQHESEMEWIHRIDVDLRGEDEVLATPGTGLSFRASEQSKVNAYGGGSSGGEEKGRDNFRAMPQAYAQCKSVREAKINGVAVETSAAPTFGCMLETEGKKLGSFETNNEGLSGCFVGSRVQKGGKLAHQNLCSSFDPAVLTCMTCEFEHKIIQGEKPICICVADQSFLANISGGGGLATVSR